MGMFDVSKETYAEYSEKWRRMASEKVGDEVVAAAPFRRGGAASSMAISKVQLGGLVYAANSLRNKKKAGGLPQNLFLIVTPTQLYAYKYKTKGRDYRLTDEVAVWQRDGLRVSTEQKMGVTMLTIESPAEGEKATLAPGGVTDTPLTDVVIEALDGSASSSASA